MVGPDPAIHSGKCLKGWPDRAQGSRRALKSSDEYHCANFPRYFRSDALWLFQISLQSLLELHGRAPLTSPVGFISCWSGSDTYVACTEQSLYL
jgi:hypothetical protein